MEQELIKPIVRIGNSAGVLLPKKWINGRAHIKLIDKPLDIKKDVLKILEYRLKGVIGIHIVGSYARKEQTERSDIDILVITEKENKRIIKGRYNLILISQENLEKTLKENIVPLLPMLKEAKPILNRSVLNNYITTPMTRKNLKWHIETTKSAMDVSKTAIELAKSNNNISDNIMYSLVLRLRGTYIVNCLIKNKNPTTKGFLNLIKELGGSKKVYEAYLRSKDGRRVKRTVSVKETEKLHDYIIKRIKRQEQWIKRKEKRR